MSNGEPRPTVPERPGLGIPLSAYLRLAVAALGVLVASYGQVVIMSERAMDWPVLTPIAEATFGEVHRAPTAVLVGLLLLLAGGALFAAAVAVDGGANDLAGARPGLGALAGDRRTRLYFAAIMAVGLVISGFLWLQLALGHYGSAYPYWWAIGIAVAAVAFLYFDRRSGVDLRVRVRVWEVAFLVAVTAGFIALNLWDLTSWYYTVIGDEYRNFQYASNLAQGASPNFFSLHGAYGVLPRAESYYIATVMDVFGEDYFGWKFSLVLAAAVVFAPLYFLLRGLFSVTAAVAGVVLLVAAQVILAYSHAGYDALFPVFPSLLAFALFFPGMKRGSALLVFAAGLAAGLGFYVIYAGRFIIIVLGLLMLLYRGRVDLKRDLPVLLFGFGLVVMPMVIVDNTDLYTLMQNESLFNYNPAVVPDPLDRIWENVLRNPVAFNYNANQQHYISGSLLEPITAVLSILGLLIAARGFRRPAFAFLLIWYAIAMAGSGIASPHPRVPMIRISYMIPIMVLFAALAVSEGQRLAQAVISNVNLRTAVPAAAIAIVLVAAVASNLYRFWEVTPNNVRNTPGAVAMKALLSDACSEGGGQTAAVVPGRIFGSLRAAIDAWVWGRPAPVLLAHDELQRVSELSPTTCVVYVPASEPPSAEDDARIQQLAGDQEPLTEFDDSGRVRALVLR